jgi:uncharacterized membrane protein
MQVFTYGRGSAEFDRGVSFFDAIYGFAITLLIVGIDLPPARAWQSVHTLLQSGFGNQIIGFTLSFVVIAQFWRVNYRLIGTMNGMTQRIIISNIVCVFFIILIPFSTQALNAPSLNRLPLPVAVYATNIALASLAQTSMYAIAKQSKLTVLSPRTRASAIIGNVSDYLLPLVFAFSVVLAFTVSPKVAEYSWLSLVVLLPLCGRLEKRFNGNVMPYAMKPTESAE